MKFYQNKLYDNRYFKDVLFYPLQVVTHSDNSVSLYGVYYNRGQMGEPWSLGIDQHIHVKPEQIGDWFEYKEPKGVA